MLEIYEECKHLSGYNATRFLQKVRRVGGLAAAKAWLGSAGLGQKPTTGFLKLVEIGRLDISVEANALRPHWRKLFTKDELAVARKRLRSFGYSGREIRTAERRALIPEEVAGPSRFVEGTKSRITVNSFERSRQARERCIAHYGSVCIACGFSFRKAYGDKVGEHIHVHHIVPLAAVGRAYNLDAIRDLRPVCPNCHAVIHLREPPFTIYEVRRMLGKREAPES
jgi:5-methylcytosine-specific restriction protein A